MVDDGLDTGVAAQVPPGHSAKPEPLRVSAVPASVPNADYAGNDFARGAQACREMMARFVEQGGDPKIACSIRANWHPGWGDDPGAPPAVLGTWEAPECPEGEALYAEYCKSVATEREPDTSAASLLQTAAMLERWAIPMLPANRHGQIPFLRSMLECAMRDLRAVAAQGIVARQAGDAHAAPALPTSPVAESDAPQEPERPSHA